MKKTDKINSVDLSDLRDLSSLNVSPGTVYITTMDSRDRHGNASQVTGVYLDKTEAILEMKGPFLRLLRQAELDGFTRDDQDMADAAKRAEDAAHAATTIAVGGGYISHLGEVPKTLPGKYSPGVEFWVKVIPMQVGRPADLAALAVDVETKDLETL